MRRFLGAGLVAIVVIALGRALWVAEFRHRGALAAWEAAPIEIPLNGPAQNSQPQRDFPWEVLLGGLALGGGAIGWVLSEFKFVDQRLDGVEAGIQKLASADELASQQREASLILLQRDLQLLENSLRELQAESDRHDRRLYRAVENLTEALNSKGLFVPRSQTPEQRGWPTDDPPTGAIWHYDRPPTPPPGEPE